MRILLNPSEPWPCYNVQRNCRHNWVISFRCVKLSTLAWCSGPQAACDHFADKEVGSLPFPTKDVVLKSLIIDAPTLPDVYMFRPLWQRHNTSIFSSFIFDYWIKLHKPTQFAIVFFNVIFLLFWPIIIMIIAINWLLYIFLHFTTFEYNTFLL